MHGAANRGTMAAVKFRIAAAAAFATGFALGIARSRRTRLRVVRRGRLDRPARAPAARSGRAPAKIRAVVVLGTRPGPGRRRGAPGAGATARRPTDALVIEMAGDLASAINGRSSLAG